MNRLVKSISFLLAFSLSSFAFVGIGVHWGFDYSLDMEDSRGNYLSIDEFNGANFLNNENISAELGISADSLFNISPIDPSELPVTLSREGFDRHAINFGGKFFIDGIPVIDAIELSCNFGLWQYEGKLRYSTGLRDLGSSNILDSPQDISYEDIFEMGELPITLEEFDMSYFGLSQTPYAKLHFDLSIRKNIIAIPDKMKILKIYAGGGPSFHMATPILTTEFVKDIIGEQIKNAEDFTSMANIMNDTELMKEIVKEIIAGMSEPKFGMHVIAGIMIKPPVLPLGFYGDMKLQIPFGELDESTGLDGYGFLFNTGLSLSIGG